MRKPQSLRDAIEAMNPDLKAHPEKLKIHVRDGHIALRYGGVEGYQYNYRLEIDIQDFTGNTNTVILPITQWLRVNQPDLLMNPQAAKEAIGLAVDVLDAHTSDISLTVNLNEAITIVAVAGGHEARYRDEPLPPDFPLTDPVVNLQQIFDGAGQITPPAVE